MNRKHYDLLVIGGGILGTFHAYHALKQKLKVAMIEKNQQPLDASVRNFGQVVPSGMNHKWQGLGRRSLDIYKDIQSKFDISVRANGSIYLASDEEERQLLHELNKINQTNGYFSEIKSADECISRYDGLKQDYIKEGLFFPEEVTLEPRIAVNKIRGYMIEQLGLKYFPRRTAIEVQSSLDSVQVTCNTGEVLIAAQATVCTGSDFSNLYPELYKNSDLEVAKLQMMQTVPQKNLSIPGSVLTGLSIRRYESFTECTSYAAIKSRESEDSMERQWGIHLLFKQTSNGSIIMGDSHEYTDVASSAQHGFDINQEINEYMLDSAKKIFQLSSWQISQYWSGLYSQCKNADLFETTIDGKVHIVTGIGGKGMTGSPALAEQRIKDIFSLNSTNI